uniref:Uncharacterized protein n=1 Tax=Arundo donax TaxID=35708 RepID=A0A0A9B0E1_ARUDO
MINITTSVKLKSQLS